jgi:hypothetical protein
MPPVRKPHLSSVAVVAVVTVVAMVEVEVEVAIAGWDDDFWGSNYQEIPSLYLDGSWNPVAEARASVFQGEDGEGDESSPERGGREQEGEGEQEEEEEEEEEEREDEDE